ncbi:hypothetical protein OIU77_002397 [Salix suchowensis]|uniref:Uncharacterized protein n=1 Tax=Salix suchowensis TaxID=1278906 RepID=A0ABQ9B4J9_9ROSI|nr:hypothetical protein OIU77_002397 [Salix suchowensis]
MLLQLIIVKACKKFSLQEAATISIQYIIGLCRVPHQRNQLISNTQDNYENNGGKRTHPLSLEISPTEIPIGKAVLQGIN